LAGFEGPGPIDPHLAVEHQLCGERPGLSDAREPEPLVEP
jgi:hypothetical protein